jgi:hypothetical protein
LYAEHGRSPNCEKCYVELLKSNQPIIDLYLRVHRQVNVAGMGESVSLNHVAVNLTLDQLDIPMKDRITIIEKLDWCFDLVLELTKQNELPLS